MPAPTDPDDGGLWDDMIAAARGEFALSAACHDIDLQDDRERLLVDAAIAAGVVGALAVMRDADEGSKRH